MRKPVVVKAWEVQGVDFPEPYKRRIRVLMAPDLHDVPDFLVSQAIFHPFCKTDVHTHDKGELICVQAGRGEADLPDGTIQLEPDVVFWVPPGVEHTVRNTGPETLKLMAFFVPPTTAKENYDRARKAFEAQGIKL